MTGALVPTHISENRALVDATWGLPSQTEPLNDYLTGTAHWINTNRIKALAPSDRPRQSAGIFGDAGITGHQPLAIYDRAGLFSAPWVWWLLRSHGCDVAVVEGWGETQETPPEISPVSFISKQDPTSLNATQSDVLDVLDTDVQILDARPPGRFSGEMAEPRPESRSGHIPGSLNIPFGSLKSGRAFLSNDDLMQIFDQAGVDLSQPIITSCGSGVTASGLAYALLRCGAEDIRVYQGSWVEWSMNPNLPIAIGS